MTPMTPITSITLNTSASSTKNPMAEGFRGYYPIVIDVETGGLNSNENALLEIAAVLLTLNSKGQLTESAASAFKPDSKNEDQALQAKLDKLYRKIGQLEIMNAIDRLYTAHPFMGSRMIRKHLRDVGLLVNRKRVCRLMKKMGIRAIAPGPHSSRSHPGSP